MATRYQISVRDTSGSQVALLTDWRRLEYTKLVNNFGSYVLEMDGDDARVDLFDLDGLIEISRVDLASVPTIPLYVDFFGLHRDEDRFTTEEGLSVFQSTGVDFNHLLDRRIIFFRTGTAGASKSGVGETVMKAFVDENAGAGATSPPRVENGVFPSFTTAVSAGGGSAWEGDRAFKKLLDTLREISEAASVDFEVVPGTAPYSFIFTAKARPLGEDRSEGNTSGNAPVVFSLGYGNMGRPAYTLSRRAEKNKIIVLGQGQPGSRTIFTKTSSAATDSPLNKIETMKAATKEDDSVALENVADTFIDKLQARETFRFDVIQNESGRYGRDYFVGDIVTARYQDIQRDLQIVGVTVTVQAGIAEEIAITVSDVT